MFVHLSVKLLLKVMCAAGNVHNTCISEGKGREWVPQVCMFAVLVLPCVVANDLCEPAALSQPLWQERYFASPHPSMML